MYHSKFISVIFLSILTFVFASSCAREAKQVEDINGIELASMNVDFNIENPHFLEALDTYLEASDSCKRGNHFFLEVSSRPPSVKMLVSPAYRESRRFSNNGIWGCFRYRDRFFYLRNPWYYSFLKISTESVALQKLQVVWDSLPAALPYKPGEGVLWEFKINGTYEEVFIERDTNKIDFKRAENKVNVEFVPPVVK